MNHPEVELDDDKLYLEFHGKIIDQLGIQMYQSPVAAIAEMISNSWDAEAETVRVTLPEVMDERAEILVADNGNGMTFNDCKRQYLVVGLNKRGNRTKTYTPRLRRPELGRKGIGKFAGFGIAKVFEVETVSATTGERTVFIMDSDKIRAGEYISTDKLEIEVLERDGPDTERVRDHGTTIRLKNLTLDERPSLAVFQRSMARRFLLHQFSSDFEVRINGTPLPSGEDLSGAEFVFPRDYELVDDNKRPERLVIADDGWGEEELANDKKIRWKFIFQSNPIQHDELRGVAVFANGKLAQSPFDFNLSGGLGGQHGREYLSGQVQADYIDELETDLIAPERQRVDWNRSETAPLRNWGQDRIKSLLVIWKELRSRKKVKALNDKLSPLEPRLEALSLHDRKTVKSALTKLAEVESISSDVFVEIAGSILTAWEKGRLKELIQSISESDHLDESAFLELLLEAEVLTSLQTAEAVRTKIDAIQELKVRIERRDKENSLRDYIAEHPWLISPMWETFIVERSVENVMRAAAIEVGLDQEEDWARRIDLALSSHDTMIVLEFMKPGVKIDRDHINRFEYYIAAIEERIRPNTGGAIQKIAGGYLVADKLEKSGTLRRIIEKHADNGLYYMDWLTLLSNAERQWKEFISILYSRSPEDPRLASLLEGTEVESDPVSVPPREVAVTFDAN